eukprot:m.153485 g.153485  ORF g.153485 m.153485 type:complete len:255 (+) comp38621_c0_seq27:1284-2048(+)
MNLMTQEGKADQASLLSNDQKVILKSQLRQHLQLTCQGYLLSFQDETLGDYSKQWCHIVEELHENLDEAGPQSIFNIPGIEEAKGLVNQDPSKVPYHQFLCKAASKRSIAMPMNAIECIASSLLKQSPLFSFWDLLPTMGFAPVNEEYLHEARPSFTQAEDNLMAIGLDRFSRKQWDLIQTQVLPTKTIKQLKIRFKNLCSARFVENPVKLWRHAGELSISRHSFSFQAQRIHLLNWTWLLANLHCLIGFCLTV